MLVTPNIEEIKRRREALGWSQHRLSKESGLTGCTIFRIEGRKSKKISRLHAREIARAPRCKVEDILLS